MTSGDGKVHEEVMNLLKSQRLNRLEKVKRMQKRKRPLKRERFMRC